MNQKSQQLVTFTKQNPQIIQLLPPHAKNQTSCTKSTKKPRIIHQRNYLQDIKTKIVPTTKPEV